MSSKQSVPCKVCIFCEKWGSGGIETFLLNVLSHIDFERFEIHLVTAELESSAYLPRLTALGLSLRVFPESTINSHIRFHTFYRMIRSEGYNVVHLNLYEGLSFGYLRAAKKAGVPIRIAHSHNAGLRKSRMRLLKLAVHQFAKYFYNADATLRIACSRSAAEFLFPKNVTAFGKWELIHNGIDVERFRFNPVGRQKMRRELGLEKQFVIGCIGRLCFQKNQEFLLRVFQEIKAQEPNALLYLIGEGEDQKKLQNWVKKYECSDSVVFYGVTDRISELLWAFDVLAFPTRFEGLGIVAIEAQAAGLPVICSDHVPREVEITDLVEFLPLKKGKERWVRNLLSKRDVHRVDRGDEVDKAGYSITSVAERLQKIWLGIEIIEAGIRS